MMDPGAIAAVAVPTGVVIGWLGRNFKNGRPANGGQSYAEGKDIGGLIAKMDVLVVRIDALVVSLAPLPSQVRLMEHIQNEVAGVNTAVRDHDRRSSNVNEEIQAGLEALAFGVQQLRDDPHPRPT